MNAYTINWILLLILSAIWGGAFTLNKFALQAYSPEVLVTGRLLIAAIVLVIFVLILFKRIEIKLCDWQYYSFMSVIGIVAPFLLISYGFGSFLVLVLVLVLVFYWFLMVLVRFWFWFWFWYLFSDDFLWFWVVHEPCVLL